MEFTLLLGVGEAIGMVEEGSTLKVWLSSWKLASLTLRTDSEQPKKDHVPWDKDLRRWLEEHSSQGTAFLRLAT